MEVEHFDDIREEFERRVQKYVWASVSTIDRQGRPRSRVLHPVWEGTTGWIGTYPDSLKMKHLKQNPYVSVAYVDVMEPVFVDCEVEHVDDVAEKRRVWEYIKGQPEPYGYDPGTIWADGPEGENFALLKLTPWRLEVYSLEGMGGSGPKVWRPASAKG